MIQFRYFQPGKTEHDVFYFFTPKSTGIELARKVRNAAIEGMEKGKFKSNADVKNFKEALNREMEKFKTPQTKEGNTI